MHKSSSAFSFFAFLSLCSCTVGPDYVRPTVEVPLYWKEAPVPNGRTGVAWKIATPQDASAAREHWWLDFHDPALSSLIAQATTSNPTIAVACAQYQQALALVEEAQAGFFPTVSASMGDAKSRTQSLAPAGGTPSTAKPMNTASIGVQASWEVDLWGTIRRQVEAGEAAAQASAALLANAQLSIQATLAQTYFQLRAVDEAQIVFDESVKAYEKFLKLTQNQYNAGTASKLAILQADAQLQAMKVMAIDNGVLRAQYEHALAVLVNQPPANFTIPVRKTDLAPPLVPVDIPSTLLERRPDIANAERLMAQANAETGVATSAYFPVLALNASRSHISKSFGQLFSAPLVVWSLGAELTQTIFDGGARVAAVKAADAAYQAAVASYRQTVLGAFQEVEDNLSTLRILKDEYTAQTRATEAAQKELKFTMNGYKAGTASSLDVLNALFNVFVAKRNAIAIAGRQMVAAVGLVKALG